MTKKSISKKGKETIKTLKNYWLCIGPKNIHLQNQATGKLTKQFMTIPKRQFDALINWYKKNK